MRTCYSFLSLAAATLLLSAAGNAATAQCATCAQPMVAYSPVMQTAYSPVVQTAYSPAVQTAYSPVYQTTVQPRVGWYPGKWVRRAFGWGDPVTTTTAVATTAAYQPTYPPSYSVGYAPSAYTVGYAPTAYTASYAPATYTVGYASTCNACGCDPCSCNTCYRPVTLSPVCGCETGCASCSGTVTAGYDYGAASGCPSCASGVVQSGYEGSPSNAASYGQQTPTPYVDPNAGIPEERESYRPDYEPAPPAGEKSVIGEESSLNLAPPLLLDHPQDQTARRPTAPVWTAVYRKDNNVRGASYTTQPIASPSKHRKLDASNWSSASK